jgi:hypothetical protein
MGFAMLDVAIGMTFMFLLLSLICSAINEMISAIFKARAKFLEEGIVHLLEDKAFAEQIYSHPLIRCLGREANPLLKKIGIKDAPSYIPARSFALALMDVVQPTTGTRGTLAPTSAVATVHSGTAASLLDTLAKAQSPVPPGVQRALVALIRAAGEDAAKARQNIEDWYNSAMDRVSGAYKRRTQYVIFAIGLVVTIGTNADSVVVFKRLTADKALASALADTAQQYAKANGATQNSQRAATEPGEGKDVKVEIDQATRNLREKLKILDGLGLPIGWDGQDEASTSPAWPGLMHLAAAWPRSKALLAIHWSGWLLTAFAVSFGAPFWFDLLNRFMVVRSTVKPKEKSADDDSPQDSLAQRSIKR